MSLAQAFLAQLRRDLLLALRHRGDLLTPLLFFVIVVCLFPLGTRPEAGALRGVAAAILWVAALLSSLLVLERLFRSDFEDGSLEQLLLSPQPTAVLVLARVLAHWLCTGLPLTLLAPLLGLLLGLPDHALPVLMASLALGTPILSLLGAVVVALTVGLPRGGLLLALLLLPLYAPVLIFGANGTSAALAGLPVAAPLYFLSAMLMLAVTLAPLAAAAALRISLE